MILDWIDINDKHPIDLLQKYLVKSSDGKVTKAFYMPDRIAWIAFYGKKTSYWMEVGSSDLLHDVTHWKKNERKEE